MVTTVKYEPHPIALLIPRPTAQEQRELDESVREVGLQAPGILYEGKVLDGVSRQIACARAQREFRTVEFMHLHPDIVAAGPVAFVTAQNLKRRHLTPSQRAMVAAESIPAYEAAAKARRLANLKNAPFEEENPKARIGALETGKSAAKAARAVGVSTTQVESARKVLKRNPTLAADVKSGRTTLAKAAKEVRKKDDRSATEIALGEIATKLDVDAKPLGKALKTPKAIVAFSKLPITKMRKAHGLVLSGFTLKDALKFKIGKLTRSNKIGDLIDKAAAVGMELREKVDGWTITVAK